MVLMGNKLNEKISQISQMKITKPKSKPEPNQF